MTGSDTGSRKEGRAGSNDRAGDTTDRADGDLEPTGEIVEKPRRRKKSLPPPPPIPAARKRAQEDTRVVEALPPESEPGHFADVVHEVRSWEFGQPGAHRPRLSTQETDVISTNEDARATYQSNGTDATPSGLPVVHALLDRIETLLTMIEQDAGTGELVLMDRNAREHLRIPVRAGSILPGTRGPGQHCLAPDLLGDSELREQTLALCIAHGLEDVSDPVAMQRLNMNAQTREVIETITVNALLRAATTMGEFPSNVRFVQRPDLDKVICRVTPLQVRMGCVREVLGKPPVHLIRRADVLASHDSLPTLLWTDGSRIFTTSTPRDASMKVGDQRSLELSLSPLVQILRRLKPIRLSHVVWLDGESAWAAIVDGNWILVSRFARSGLGKTLASLDRVDSKAS